MNLTLTGFSPSLLHANNKIQVSWPCQWNVQTCVGHLSRSDMLRCVKRPLLGGWVLAVWAHRRPEKDAEPSRPYKLGSSGRLKKRLVYTSKYWLCFFFKLFCTRIHYSYNQLANHLLQDHHLGNAYLYSAHCDALYSFTSSWAQNDNNNN